MAGAQPGRRGIARVGSFVRWFAGAPRDSCDGWPVLVARAAENAPRQVVVDRCGEVREGRGGTSNSRLARLLSLVTGDSPLPQTARQPRLRAPGARSW